MVSEISPNNRTVNNDFKVVSEQKEILQKRFDGILITLLFI